MAAARRVTTIDSDPRGPLVVAVVVTWNGGDVTRRCVDSLRLCRAELEREGSGRLHILVVDNASEDGERSALEREYGPDPEVELLLLDENRHFAGGVNAGARRGIELEADYLYFLNNDTEHEPESVARLVAAGEEHPDVGILGPITLDLNDRRPLSLGERYTLGSLPIPRTLLKVRSTGDGQPYGVGGIMGNAIMVRRSCFEATGPYREDIFVYYEEVDFCLRARWGGFRVMVVPRAVCLHDGLRGFTAGLTPYAAHLKCRNPLVLLRDYRRPLAWIPFLPVFFGIVGASTLLYAMRGNWPVVRAMWRGIGDGFRGLP